MSLNTTPTGDTQQAPAGSISTLSQQALSGLDGLLKDHPGAHQHMLQQLKRKGGEVVIEIAPHLVKRSRYANRHPASFATKEFTDLKAAIEQRGGNTVPIIVRPLKVTAGEHVTGETALYEIVAGHRRHQACRELGFNVKAIVLPAASDTELTLAMYDENNARTDLTPWEVGCMYRQWLTDSLFPSQNKLAIAIGRSPADVSRALFLADLDKNLLDAFESPLVLQFKDADELRELLKTYAEPVAQAVAQLTSTVKKHNRADVFRALRSAASQAGGVGPTNSPLKTLASKARKIPLRANDIDIGRMEWGAGGNLKLTLDKELSSQAQKKLETMLKKFLSAEIGVQSWPVTPTVIDGI